MRNLSMKEQDKSTENKAKKNLGYRVFAAILAALSIGIFFIPCISIGPITYLEEFLFKVIGELFGNAPFKAFGFLPSFLMSGYLLNDFATCIFYFFLLCCVITLVLGVVAVFCKKKAPTLLRVATYFFAVGCTLQAAIVVSYYYIEFRLLVLDYFFLAFAACAVLLYFVLACIKLRKGVWSNMALGIFSIIVCVAIGMTAAFDSDSISQAFNAMGLNHDTVKLIFAILGAVLIVNYLLSAMRFIQKKCAVADLIRYCVMLVIAGFITYAQLANKDRDVIVLILAIIATVVTLGQIALTILEIVAKKKALKNAVEEENKELNAAIAETATAEEVYVRDEYAEAIPYTGGPVEGVEMAEEVADEAAQQTAAPETPKVETADYNFYNTKSFDPFIASLSTEERNQFTELYILNYKGTMPEIPSYEVGGNNKDFFRKVFIYLGQYRDRIPDGLLSKMYEFASKL